ncbi:MAG: hypothetical protein MZV63_14535 [Marinilabiliales bacterium]|nr:hypothetical protein [Marinilabiliales bacterium]
MAVIISARIEGGLVFAGKYAKKFGLCQWVIPGIIISSKSLNNSCQMIPDLQEDCRAILLKYFAR